MIYKQNAWSRAEPAGAARIDDERKLLELWQEEEVDEDYQAVVLRFLDGLQSKAELHRHIQNELRATYQRDSHFFRIDKLMQEREKTREKMEREVGLLERFKRERGEPDLEPACLLLDHTRKVHLLIAEEVHEMFNAFGHPQSSGVGFSYLSLFRDFDEDVQFLKESLLRFYMPFSGGFDPLFLELSQRLRKCYANESLVYDEHVEELVNLNASYLYRLLRAHQRMLEAISIADRKEEEPVQFISRAGPSPNCARSMLGSIAEEEPKARPFQQSQLLESSRIAKEDRSRFSTPKDSEPYPHYRHPRTVSPTERKATAEIGVQKQAPRLQIVKESIRIPRQKEKVVQERASLLTSVRQSPKHSPHSPSHSEEYENKIVKTPRKLNKAFNSSEEQESKPLRFYRKIQPSPPTISHMKNIHKRTHTEDSTILKRKSQESQLREFLPKLNGSRDKPAEVRAECLCRQRYRDKHCEQHEEELSEGELERRRKAIMREIQAKYKLMAQREMRHQLSKLGDSTYHRLRNQQHSRQSRTIKNARPL